MVPPFLIRSLGLLVLVLLFRGQSYSQDDYQKWLQDQNRLFRDFKDARDREFVDFLKQEWKEMQLALALSAEKEPKPLSVPVSGPVGRVTNETASGPAVVNVPEAEIPPPPPEEIRADSEALNNVALTPIPFYDTSIGVHLPRNLKGTIGPEIGNESIRSFWAFLSHANCDPLIRETLGLRSAMRLNDWGYLLLISACSGELYPPSSNEATAVAWFFLTKAGYAVRIGYTADRLYLLLPSKETIYQVPYLTFPGDGSTYYALSLPPGREKASGPLFTYEGKYPGAETVFDLSLSGLPAIRRELVTRNLTFTYGEHRYTLPTDLDKNAVDFLLWYPQTEYPVYFNASLSSYASGTFLKGMADILRGTSELTAVNMLLRFCQTAFGYKTDQEQFGREKPFFPEETLYYEYSDCEDRAALFSLLVRSLLGLDVVGLEYPSHLAAAVKFSTPIGDDRIEYRGGTYTICDPTFVNADAGVSMPKLRSLKPDIIPLGQPKR